MAATMNERLRTIMLRTGTTTEDLALCCGVDVKTAERWISPGRVPHRRHRWAAARRLGCEDDYLWPDAPGESAGHRAEASRSELVRLYPDRGSIPRETWRQLLDGARDDIGILVYAALFLAEDATARRLLAERASAGVRVRLLIGDPDSPAVAQRGEEEGIGPVAIGAKIRNVLALFRPLLDVGAEIRLHSTVLYNSLYRGDDDLLVNTHILGSVAACAPVLHLRRLSGGALAAAYLECFDRIWDEATPWTGPG
jgi:transcriptional regulator with XRE-family HTH domain